jgi:hypothetical protein
MERSLESAIEERLTAYLAGAMTLEEFKMWLVSETWRPDRYQVPADLRLANEIKLALAEHSSGFRTDEELRGQLETKLSSVASSSPKRKVG